MSLGRNLRFLWITAALALVGCSDDNRPLYAERLNNDAAVVVFPGERKLLVELQGYPEEQGCVYAIASIASSADSWKLKKGGSVIGTLRLEVTETCV